jgi:hypothetical protein
VLPDINQKPEQRHALSHLVSTTIGRLSKKGLGFIIHFPSFYVAKIHFP